MTITLIVKKGEDGFLFGKLKEFPAVMSQGKTYKELVENIQEVLELYLDYLREESNENENDSSVIIEEKELYTLSACN